MPDASGAKCNDLRKILKTIDEDFDITFDYAAEKYYVTHNGRMFESVPYGEFTRATIARFRRTVWLNRTGRLFDYIDQNNERVEAAEDRAIFNYSEALAKELRRPLINSYYY